MVGERVRPVVAAERRRCVGEQQAGQVAGGRAAPGPSPGTPRRPGRRRPAAGRRTPGSRAPAARRRAGRRRRPAGRRARPRERPAARRCREQGLAPGQAALGQAPGPGPDLAPGRARPGRGEQLGGVVPPQAAHGRRGSPAAGAGPTPCRGSARAAEPARRPGAQGGAPRPASDASAPVVRHPAHHHHGLVEAGADASVRDPQVDVGGQAAVQGGTRARPPRAPRGLARREVDVRGGDTGFLALSTQVARRAPATTGASPRSGTGRWSRRPGRPVQGLRRLHHHRRESREQHDGEARSGRPVAGSSRAARAAAPIQGWPPAAAARVEQDDAESSGLPRDRPAGRSPGTQGECEQQLLGQ